MAGEWIRRSRRPSILAGAGVRLSGAVDRLRRTVEQLGIPLLTSRLGMDLIEYEHPLFVGRPGTYGDRPANFTIQNCDLLLVMSVVCFAVSEWGWRISVRRYTSASS